MNPRSLPRRVAGLALVVALCPLAPAGPAAASAPVDQVKCTTEPRSKWLPEDEIKRRFGVEKFAQVKFKVSRTNCYEFYAIGKDGGVTEAYYHPVTGKLVKETRVGAAAAPSR